MDVALSSKRFGPAALKQMNYCRMYLNVSPFQHHHDRWKKHRWGCLQWVPSRAVLSLVKAQHHPSQTYWKVMGRMEKVHASIGTPRCSSHAKSAVRGLDSGAITLRQTMALSLLSCTRSNLPKHSTQLHSPQTYQKWFWQGLQCLLQRAPKWHLSHRLERNATHMDSSMPNSSAGYLTRLKLHSTWQPW